MAAGVNGTKLTHADRATILAALNMLNAANPCGYAGGAAGGAAGDAFSAKQAAGCRHSSLFSAGDARHRLRISAARCNHFVDFASVDFAAAAFAFASSMIGPNGPN